MKCAICRNGATQAGMTTVVLEKDGTTLVYKQVPAEICDNCGEAYISADTNRALLQHAKQETRRGVALELLNFAA